MGKYYIKTYGCQMNLSDSEKLAQVFESAGYQAARKAEEADILLVNTCVVRQTAEDRAAWYITSAKGLKEINPRLKIGVCGCFVTEPRRDFKKAFPHVDIFIEPSNPQKLRKFLADNAERGMAKAERSALRTPHSAFVTIMHGCDNFCSYCVVPYVRGREVSRPMDEVLAEIKGLIEQGVKEITLLGQNVNSYEYGLANLLRGTGKILDSRKLKVEIRFLTCHPRDMSDEIIETVAKLPFVAKEFMMPLQSGDDDILKEMNRGYTLHYYMDRVNKIRSLMPQARITTDILIGFPGETDEQFQNTLRAIETIKFNEVHMFAYSDRPGTAAEKMEGKVPDEVKRDRLRRLIELVREVVRLYHVQ